MQFTRTKQQELGTVIIAVSKYTYMFNAPKCVLLDSVVEAEGGTNTDSFGSRLGAFIERSRRLPR